MLEQLYKSGNNDAFAAARLHSRHVKLLKKALPLVAVIIVLIFSWFTFLVSPPTADILTLNTPYGENHKLIMVQPKVEGYSRANQPYMFTAARAIQDPSRPGMIELEEIAATMPLGARGAAQIQAQGGIFDNVNGRMVLDRSFQIETSGGVAAYFLSADVDVTSSQLVSHAPVEVSRQGEYLTAGRLRIVDGGQIFIFEGGVSLTIAPKSPS